MRAAILARRAALIACTGLLTACAHKSSTLYMWEEFPRMQYEALLKNGAADGTTAGERVEAMQAHAEKARAAGASLPPGFRAHMGMLKLATGDVASARELWESEKSAFPESTPYIDQLLKRLDAPVAKDNPA
jgi:hypothetical protein